LGALGLVVDFGWAYWRKEAASTAAMAAASAAVVSASGASSQACGTGTNHWNCSSAYSCPSNPVLPVASNLDNACLYAKQNGFVNTGRQTVTLTAGTGTPPNSAISTAYYVTATVTEQIPMLFSAAIGNQWAQVTGTSTAAVMAQGGG